MNKPNIIILTLLLACGIGVRAQDIAAPNPPTQAEVDETVNAPAAVVAPEAPAEPAIPEAVPVTAAEVEGEAGPNDSGAKAREDNRNNYVDRDDIVTISNDSLLGREERSRDFVTIMGNSVSEGYVDGDMVTVLGNSKLDGYVEGDYVVVMGSADFGPNAEVDGDVVVIGGRLNLDPTSKIGGEKVSIPFFSPGMVEHFQELPAFVRECVFLGRPISPKVIFTLYIAGIFLLFYLLLAALFPRPMERSRQAIEDKPLQSFFAGVLVLACHIPFMVIMLITVVGALLIPIADMALLSIAIFGKAVVFFFLGKQVARAMKAGFLEHAILSIILGGVIVYALYMIPFFGMFLWFLLSVLGLGAVSIAIGDSISERKAARIAAMPAPAVTSTPPPLSGVSGDGGAEPKVDADPTVTPGLALSQVDPATASIFPRVGFWWRTLASLIDLLLIGVLTNVLNIATPMIPVFAYFIIFWGWKGSTLGGMALGLRVQKLSGEPMDWATAIIRSLSSIVSFLPFFIGFFWAGWDPDNQSWHDKIAGTTVVRIPKGYTWS
jgi:uncharacterized RDD family membrane protein YckC